MKTTFKTFLGENELKPKVHKFRDDADAYDSSQTDDDIKDGDVLVTPTAVAILYQAWPIIVSGESRAFHKFKDGSETWETFEGGRYLPSYRLAVQQVTK